MYGKVGEVRNSQLISTFGPGAIMDLPDFSVIIASLDHWNTKLCDVISEPRLLRKLRINKIYAPPASLDWEQDNKQGTLPAFRFPKYMVCPSCRKLAPFDKFRINKDQIAYCHCADDIKVFPARFIVACSKGHIDEFPWHYYVHSKSKKGNLDCVGDLFLNDKGVSGAISDIEVECKVEGCNAKRTLEDAFGGVGIPSCRGRRPWIGDWGKEECIQKSRALLRGASNLYFPLVVSALSIPPYTSLIQQVVAEEMERLGKMDTKQKLQERIEEDVFPSFKEFDLDELWEVIVHQRSLGGEEQDLYYPEWVALHHGTVPNAKLEFETEEQEVPDRYKDKLAKLIMVRRLTEVRVLAGFSRIEPLPDITAIVEEDENEKESFKAYLSGKKLPWLPGIITRGEGIFVVLNEEALREWEKKVEGKEDPMRDAFISYCKDRNLVEQSFPGTRYVLLHTLSHALMRQLCMGSGYSSTSIRERIYSRNIDGQRMAGILIYTATPDSEGSLGGLVELGKSEKFEEILFHAIEDAKFCSGDPLCSEHSPDAIGDLNGAACHACQLAAETSCEKSNRFLDRTFLVPTVSEHNLAYFS